MKCDYEVYVYKNNKLKKERITTRLSTKREWVDLNFILYKCTAPSKSIYGPSAFVYLANSIIIFIIQFKMLQ